MSSSTRLVDYFCIIGFDREKQRGRFSSGKVIQRFPSTDWPDVPFIDGIELFCQPQGWCLSRHQVQPTFFTSVLTDIQANRHYCSCLKFQELVTVDPPKHADESEDMYPVDAIQMMVDGIQMIDESEMYDYEYDQDGVTMNMFAPKCLVIVSRHHFIQTFRNCLGLMYKVFLNGNLDLLEPMIASLVSSILVPKSPGIRFSFQLITHTHSPSIAHHGQPTNNQSSTLKDNLCPLKESNLSQSTTVAPQSVTVVPQSTTIISQSTSSISQSTTISPQLTTINPQSTTTVPQSVIEASTQTIQTLMNSAVPASGTTVYQLFTDLGIHTCVQLFSAVMTEHKILFHSKSYNRLFDSCQAVTCLLYPFKYTHIYIPLLPSSLLEVLSTPTPFLIGLHSSLKNEVSDLLDVIILDLDSGHLSIPDCIHLPSLLPSTNHELQSLLRLVLTPHLNNADHAFPPPPSPPSPPAFLDKEIRAIFIRLFAQLLSGYRSCLQTVRIHPKPFITFHKAAFLGQRNLVENEFVVRLLDCMFFNSFIQERGIPFRSCDLFDDICSITPRRLKEEAPQSTLDYIKRLADKLYRNENPHDLPPPPMVRLTPEELSATPTFPTINSDWISERIESVQIQREMIPENESDEETEVEKVVPTIQATSGQSDFSSLIISNSARRLEVMKNCVSYIFENRISDARKTFPAVLRALKNNWARLALAQELSVYVTGNKSQLSHEQFDLVVRLMNCALQQDCDSLNGTCSGVSGYGDVNGVAAAIMPLAMSFCRKLATHVIQFAYTCLQDHPIWNNLSFWESTFYRDVEKDLKRLYLNEKFDSVTALEVAAEEMKRLKCGKVSKCEIEEYSKNEEKTLFSQAVHFANRIVALKIPLDIGGQERIHGRGSVSDVANVASDMHSDSNSYITGALGSVRDGGHHDHGHEDGIENGESGFEEDKSGSGGRGFGPSGEISASAIKFTTRFLDKVCTEGELGEEYVKNLHQNVPMVVAMQVETLEGVYRESRNLPPVSKPNIVTPHLIQGEQLMLPGIRAFLMPDGRDENYGSGAPGTGTSPTSGLTAGPVLLPAEGAIFVTNYRVIFRGRPCDPFYAELPVLRSFPISTLTKEKRISLPSNYLVAAIDHFIQEGLQLRSNTFQLLKIAFDEEVTSDQVDNFRKLVNRARCPPDIYSLFAFTSSSGPLSSVRLLPPKDKHGYSTFKGVARKTLARAGIQIKSHKSKTSNKYSVPSGHHTGLGTPGSPSKIFLPGTVSPTQSESSIVSNSTTNQISTSTVQGSPVQVIIPPGTPLSGHRDKDPKTLQKLIELSYLKDFYRLGLGSKKDILQVQTRMVSRSNLNDLSHFRITSINCNYSVVRTYPTFLVVPNIVHDESLKKLARGYRSNRLPAIVWRHPLKRGLLLRSASFHGKGLVSMLIASSSGQMGSSVNPSGDSINFELEKYFRAIINLTPSHFLRKQGTNEGVPKPSISSVIEVSGQSIKSDQGVKSDQSMKSDQSVKSEISAMKHKSYGSSTLKGMQKAFGNTLGKSTAGRGSFSSKHKSVNESFEYGPSDCRPATLHILGEKSLLKGLKTDSFSSCSFIPLDIHDVKAVKGSFKKLLRACCPSSLNTDPDLSFFKSIKSSDWFTQLQNILQVSTMVVDLIHIQGSSVIVSLEDGWDLVPQITSISQICLDPFYRTFEGFLTLVEKEWLSFGHRFTHRLNQTASTMTSGFAPIFLQFLDLVHQLLNQFPLSFEFNHYLLKTMAYHHVSCRFRTFLLDSESERSELGWLLEDVSKKIEEEEEDEIVDLDVTENEAPSLVKTLTSSLNNRTSLGMSFFEYARRIWSKSSMFYNFLYVPSVEVRELGLNVSGVEGSEVEVLRPSVSFGRLEIWDFYTQESLAHGSCYDIELIQMEKQRREEMEATLSDQSTTISSNPINSSLISSPLMSKNKKSVRTLCNESYDSVVHDQPSEISQLLENIRQLESLLLGSPSKWSTIWSKIEIPFQSMTSLSKSAQLNSTNSLVSLGCVPGHLFHKSGLVPSSGFVNPILPHRRIPGQPSIDTGHHLVPGTSSNSYVYSHRPHRFEKYAFSKPSNCDLCKNVLWGLVRTGIKCSACGYNCHDRCSDSVPKNCQGYRGPIDTKATLKHSTSTGNEAGKNDGGQTMRAASRNEGQSGHHSAIGHQGLLLKRGALLKNWKQRWFVLDSVKHQLRYYDSAEDRECKGFIDLSDVVSVQPHDSVSFDLKTTKRSYQFSAGEPREAKEWVDKIQACLQ